MTTVTPSTNPKFIAALEAVLLLRLRVFPCVGKKPRIKRWQHEATNDPVQILKWWTLWPDANPACATGVGSNVVVLDFDPGHGGDDIVFQFEQRFGQLPDTWQVLTGGGGWHYYFRHPGGYVRSSANRFGPGVDVKADGGYVMLPGSTHPDTKRTYYWEVNHDPRG